ncbi:MAG: hypothetical protein CM1200mP16_00540 [Nitrospina sp.]|nr:MAG: hypothetical protein CM1200mP16_00540 [Nitrospina sp.]
MDYTFPDVGGSVSTFDNQPVLIVKLNIGRRTNSISAPLFKIWEFSEKLFQDLFEVQLHLPLLLEAFLRSPGNVPFR